MGKIAKGLLYLLGLLIGLVIIMAIAIPLVVDPNDYRDEISEIVSQKTGRNLDITGEIGLSLFPWIGIELGEMSLSNARGFGDKPFARVKKIDIKIKLLPLLRKAVEMDTIVLHGMSLNLAKNSSGVDNWSDLAQPATPPSAAATPQPSPSEEASPTKMLSALAINGLEINNAHISWDDQSQQQRVEIEKLNLVSGAISLDSEFPLEFSFNSSVKTAADPASMDGTITLKTLIKLDIEEQQYQLNQLLLTADLKSPQLPGGRLKAAIGGNLSADLLQQIARAEAFTLRILGTELVLNSTVTRLDKAPQVNGDIALIIGQAEPLLAILGDALPDTINAQIIETTALNTNFSANIESQQVALEQFRLNFDQSSIKGQASVNNFARPAVRYDFDVDHINVDRYFPAANNSPTPAATLDTSTKTTSTSDEPLPIPVELLRTLDIDGSLRLGALQVMKLRTQKMVATVKAKGGDINLAPLSAELYQGRFDGAINIDVRNKVPKIKLDENLTGVEAGPLLKDLLGKDYVTGKALLKANIVTRGDHITQFKKELNGKAELRFEDGTVNGIDIAQLIREANATYKRQPVPQSSEKPKTDFALLSASINIKDGLVTNNDLSAQSPLLRVTGEGQADLVTEKIDYRVKAAVVNTLEGQGGKGLTELKGVTIPLAIKGTFASPKFRVDLAQILDEKSKAKLEAVKESAREETRQKIEDKKEILKNRLEDKLKLKF